MATSEAAAEGTTGTSRRGPLLLAVAVLAGAVLLVAGLLAGAALSGSSTAAPVPDDTSVDAGFARDMQVHHGQAVEMSVMLRERSDDVDVRGMALDILLTQQNQQGQMQGWLQTWGLPPASAQPVMAWMSDAPFEDSMAGMDMGEDEQAAADGGAAAQNPMVAMGLATDDELAALEAAQGVEAERLYLQLMIDHHQGGIDMAEVAAAEATQPQVQRLAQAMAQGQAAELVRLQDLLDARGGPVDLQG